MPSLASSTPSPTASTSSPSPSCPASPLMPASVHAVLLAAGQGSRMGVLTSSAAHPKALLPIANRPMLFYSLLHLVRSAVTRITVIADGDHVDAVRAYVLDTFPSDPVVAKLLSSTAAAPPAADPSPPFHSASTTASAADSATAGAGSNAHAAVGLPPITVVESNPEENGTAAALLALAPLPCNDTLILSSDLVAAQLDLAALLRTHRSTRSVCTALLVGAPPDAAHLDPAAAGAAAAGAAGGGKQQASSKASKANKSSSKKGGKSSSSSSAAAPVDHYTVLSPDNRLLALLHPSDVTNHTVPIRPALLSRYPHLTVRSDLRDPHAYVLHTAFLQRVLALRPLISSARFDLVPYLARRQHALSRNARADELPLPAAELRVSAHVVEQDPTAVYLARANTAETYREANIRVAAGALDALLYPETASTAAGGGGGGKKAKKKEGKNGAAASSTDGPQEQQQSEQKKSVFSTAGERTSVTPDCAVANGVTAGDRVSLKKSVVGSNCTLATGVKLNGCVLMSGVRIEEGANLANCVVADGATIGANGVLKSCRVAAEMTVEADTEASDRDFVPVDATAAFDLGDDIEFC